MHLVNKSNNIIPWPRVLLSFILSSILVYVESVLVPVVIIIIIILIFSKKNCEEVTATGIEPATLGLLDPRSNQLSYAVSSQYCNVQTHQGTLPHTVVSVTTRCLILIKCIAINIQSTIICWKIS